jgi:hypothetical protein
MINFKNMSPSDAAYNLRVLQYLIEHKEELQAIAAKTSEAVSMLDVIVQNDSNLNVAVEMWSARFVPLTICVFPNESEAAVLKPQIAMYCGTECSFPEIKTLTAISQAYGIDPCEKTWTVGICSEE